VFLRIEIISNGEGNSNQLDDETSKIHGPYISQSIYILNINFD